MRYKAFFSMVACSLTLMLGTARLSAQEQQLLTPDQLNDVVAPVALYPDEMLSQVLVASTYPLEVVEAFQWMQKNPGLAGPALTEAARQQNWDASVQALTVFPDVLRRLNDDVAWTTALGNAFQSQQQDVMDAVQRMRLQAQQAGKLQSSAEENVVMSDQGGEAVIQIEPASADVMYVPVYDPAWIWGAARWYPYPRWYWPARPTVARGFFSFGPAIHVGFYFGGGWNGWAGWGWRPGWSNHTVIVNNTFVERNRFTAVNGNVGGTSVWTHDAGRRAGLPAPRTGFEPQRNAFPTQRPEPPRPEAPRSEQRPMAAPRPEYRPAPVTRPEPPARLEAPRSEPRPLAAPHPDYRPAPATRPEPAARPEDPRSEPRPMGAPRPEYRPAPATRPEPAARPEAPRSEPRPMAAPRPEYRPAPAPASRPAPAREPAPAFRNSFSGGRRR